MPNTTVDLTIVGAGFAGLACATRAAQRGLHTHVLERKATPDEALHTTGILVKEAAELMNLPHRLCRKILGVRLYAPSLRYIDLHSPDYYFLATDLPALMHHLAQRAERAGAQLHYGQSFRGARRHADAIELAGTGLRCRYLVGCDGARSRVAQQFKLGQNHDFLAGVETEFTGLRGLDEQFMHVFVDSQLAPGYIAWALPGIGITQIGLAVRRPAKPKLDRLLAKLRGLFDFSAAQAVAHRAGLIPCGGPLRRITAPRVLLLGDAAGTVSPLTAGGIHPAWELGDIAGTAIDDYLRHDGPAPAHVLHRATSSYRYKKWLRRAYDRHGPSNRVFDRLFEVPAFRSLAQTIFFHHRGLLSLSAWRDILGSLRNQARL